MTGFKFLQEIDGRKIEIVPSAGRPDFFRSLAVCSQRFNSSVSGFLEKLPSFSASIQPTEDRQISEAFELICYRVAEYAEFFETACNQVPALRDRRYKTDVKSYHSSIKSHFRDWNLVCNRIKHNGNQLVHIRMQYDSGEVGYGFSLILPIPPDSWGINHDLHSKGTRCMSYTRALNQMIFDICKADKLLCHLIKRVEDSEYQTPISAPKLQIINLELLERIEKINHVALMGDLSRLHIPSSQGELIEWSTTASIPPSVKAKVSAYYTGDGVSRSFPII